MASSDLSWAIPPGLTTLISLDTPARAASIERLLSQTHPTIHPIAPVASSAATTAAASIASTLTPPFLSALKNATKPDALTWNGALGFSSTENALLDLFEGLQAGARADKVFALLPKAWECDPDRTLRIIFHARSIHEGKGLKDVFFYCVAWLCENHPRTLLANLRLIVEPTCERPPTKRDEAKTGHKGVVALDDDFEPKEPAYPPRPHGSFDDLNDILVLAINGQLSTGYTGRLTAIDHALAPESGSKIFRSSREGQAMGGKHDRRGFKNAAREARKEAAAKDVDKSSLVKLAEKLTLNKRKREDEDAPLSAKLARCGTKQARATVIAQHTGKGLADPKLQILIAAVVNLYAEFISADLGRLKLPNAYLTRPEADRKADGFGTPGSSPHLFGMSYAAKWAPTPGKSADRQLRLGTALATKLFPTDDLKTSRRRLQNEVLAPLRRVLAVPETKMVKGPWDINYTKVPARAIARNVTNFVEHDPDGFERYLQAFATGKPTIAGASLFPHDILKKAVSKDHIEARVANLQWTALVTSIRASAKTQLENCIAVADVSGSMGSIGHPTSTFCPIWPCVALTLLMTDLARPPWNGSFITFHSNPSVEYVDNSKPVSERAKALASAEWGLNTNYRAVFEAILQVAKNSKLAPEDMVKKVFVFSDMQFDASLGGLGNVGHAWGQCNNPSKWGETEHAAVVRRFAEEGYSVPELIYWNLQTATAKPVQADTPGTALVSGFSGALMKYFLRAMGDSGKNDEWEEVGKDGDEKMGGGEAQEKNPMDHLNAMISTAPFSGVVVVD